MDGSTYLKVQKDAAAQYESLCLRCGECCGAGNDPCANLARMDDGKYFCTDYEKRLGPRKTVSGRSFTCVEISDNIKKGLPNSSCGYMRANR